MGYGFRRRVGDHARDCARRCAGRAAEGGPQESAWRAGRMPPAGYREVVPLTDRDRALLDFEGEWRRHRGAKEEAIRTELGLSPARYYQLLGRLIDTVEALEHDPMLVKRLRRVRDSREQARLARAAGR